MNKSLRKRIIIGVVVTLVAITTLLIVWSCQVVERYHVDLHYNYFEYSGYTDDNQSSQLPFEIMLTQFKADTTTNDGTYLAETLIQPRGNKLPDNIECFTFAPYQVHIYENYRLFIEQYEYNPSQGLLYVTMIVERRRYQTWFNSEPI